MTSPALAVLLVLHVVAVVVGYGAVSATGAFARTCRTVPDPAGSERLLRFFDGTPNRAARLVFVVPLIGFALLGVEPSGEFTRAYPWVGLTIWMVTIGIATGALWPAEERIGALLRGKAEGGRAELERLCRVVERAAGACVALVVVAAAVMIARF